MKNLNIIFSYSDDIYDEIQVMPIDNKRNNSEILEGYHWIRVNILENSSDVDGYIDSELRKAININEESIKDRFATFLDDIKLNRSELKSEQDINALRSKLSQYLSIRTQLKNSYEEALGIFN